MANMNLTMKVNISNNVNITAESKPDIPLLNIKHIDLNSNITVESMKIDLRYNAAQCNISTIAPHFKLKVKQGYLT